MSLGRVVRWWRPLRRSDGARTASTPLPHVCIVMYDYNRDMMIEEEIMNALAYGTVDNQPGSVAKLQQVSDFFKTSRWPAEYAKTTHRLHPGDARDLSWIADKTIHLVVTMPLYADIMTRTRKICIAVVGVNHAAGYTSFEGDRSFTTDGTARFKHPSQEAAEPSEDSKHWRGQHLMSS